MSDFAIEICGESNNIVGSLGGCIFSFGSVSGKSSEAGLFQAVLTGLPDGLAAALVFVIGGDIADALVEPDPVVLRPHDGQLGAEGGRILDRQ